MTITATDIYGSGVLVDVTTPTEPKLIINLKNFENTTSGGEITSGLGLDDVSVINAGNIDSFASQIKYALDQMHLQKQPATDTDETNGSYVEAGRKRFATRNNVTQILYEVTTFYYTADSSSDLDPDNIVTS